MNTNSKIYIAGHSGMVGSAIERKLRKEGYTNFVQRKSSELDLRNQVDVGMIAEVLVHWPLNVRIQVHRIDERMVGESSC